MSARLGKGKIRDLLDSLDEEAMDVAAEVIAEDLKRLDLKEFVKALLECCPIECIAKAVVKAESAGRVSEGSG